MFVASLTGLGGTGGRNFLYRDLNLSTSTTGSLISTGSCLTGMGISFSANVIRHASGKNRHTWGSQKSKGMQVCNLPAAKSNTDLVLAWRLKIPSSASGWVCFRPAHQALSSHSGPAHKHKQKKLLAQLETVISYQRLVWRKWPTSLVRSSFLYKVGTFFMFSMSLVDRNEKCCSLQDR